MTYAHELPIWIGCLTDQLVMILQYVLELQDDYLFGIHSCIVDF